MKDQYKTKKQLIEEMEVLRKHLVKFKEAETKRQRVEESLQTTNERLNYLLTSTSAAIYTAKTSGDYGATSITDNIKQMTGYEPREFIENSNFWIDHVHPEDRERILNELPGIFEQESYIYEYRFLYRDGNYGWVRDDMKLTRDKFGNPIEIIGYWIDITERKQAEEELRKNAEQYRIITSTSMDGFGIVDVAGHILDVNEAYSRMIGYSRDELLKMSVSDIEAKKKPEEIQKQHKKAMAASQLFESQHRRKDGRVIDVELSMTYMRQSGEIFVFLRDITERKQAESALKESEERYRHVVEGSPAIVWSFSDKHGTVFASSRVESILGYSPDFLYENPWLWNKSIHPDDQDSVAESVRDFAAGKDLTVEYRIKDSSGNWRWFHDRSIGKRMEGEATIIEGISIDITERKQAEEKLQESEKKYRTVVEISPDGIAIASKGRQVFVNQSLARIFGVSDPVELLDKPVLDYIHPDYHEIVRKRIETVIKGGALSPLSEEKMIRPDGRVIQTEVAVAPLEYQGEAATLAIIRDITERKRAEEALQESEERFRLAFENANTGMCLVDLDGNLARVNNKMCEIFGYTKQELERMTVNDIAHPEDIDKSPAFIQKTLRGEIERGTFEKRYFHKKGHVVTCQVSSSLVRNANGLPLYFISHIHDITERKRAEGALRESEERYRTLVETSPDAIALVDLNLNVLMVNRPALALYGYESPEEVVGRSALNFIAAEDRPRAVEELQQVLEKGSLANSEYTQLRKGDVPFPAELSASLILDGEKRPFAIICVTRDISIRKQAEEERAALEDQLRQSQKMEAIGQLAGGVAHDFNNLLTVIKGYCQLSLAETKESAPIRDALEVINKATEKAADLTRQLLAFSRRQIMEVRVLDLNALLQNLDKMLRRIIGEDIELVTVLGEDIGRVKADPGQIEQVVMNLAVNAKDAMSKGGKLIIETANVELDEAYAHAHVAVTPGRYVMIAVSDTGTGMGPEVRDRVFEPFFTTKGKGRGTGLGLSTVYGIVKQSNGNIWVYSEPGKGTTFKIFLPRVDEPAEKLKVQETGEEFLRGSETILVVEDDKEVRNLAVRILKRQGYTVLDGSYGDEAFNVCRQHKGPIHLLLTDVVMPGMDGRALSESLSQLHPEMKVLYMSGYTDDAIVRHGVMAKGMNYIQKPFTVNGLTKKVREVLEQ